MRRDPARRQEAGGLQALRHGLHARNSNGLLHGVAGRRLRGALDLRPLPRPRAGVARAKPRSSAVTRRLPRSSAADELLIGAVTDLCNAHSDPLSFVQQPDAALASALQSAVGGDNLGLAEASNWRISVGGFVAAHSALVGDNRRKRNARQAIPVTFAPSMDRRGGSHWRAGGLRYVARRSA